MGGSDIGGTALVREIEPLARVVGRRVSKTAVCCSFPSVEWVKFAFKLEFLASELLHPVRADKATAAVNSKPQALKRL